MSDQMQLPIEQRLLCLLAPIAKKLSLWEVLHQQADHHDPAGPQLGDLVVEVSHRHRDPDAFGWLVHRDGPVTSPDLLIIACLPDGHLIPWRNAEVRSLPPQIAELARTLFPESFRPIDPDQISLVRMRSGG